MKTFLILVSTEFTCITTNTTSIFNIFEGNIREIKFLNSLLLIELNVTSYSKHLKQN